MAGVCELFLTLCHQKSCIPDTAANMPLAPLRAPLRGLTHRIPSRSASTSSRQPLKYSGRIPKPAPPPPGPGETKTPDTQEETQQARKAIMDSIQEDRNKDYKKRYRSFAFKWTSIIVGTPFVIFLTPYLYKRGAQNILKRDIYTTLISLCSFPWRRTKKTCRR